MTFEVKNDFESKIKNDLNKKYLKSGFKIAGSINGGKVKLYLEDDFGKHSAFMSQYFYGKIINGKITGQFRPANYVIILLIVLFLVAVESITAAVIFGGYSSVILPAVIIAAEVFYLYYLKRTSSENNELIKNYLLML